MTKRVNRPYLKSGAKLIVYSSAMFAEIDKLVIEGILTIKEILGVVGTSKETFYRNMKEHFGSNQWEILLNKYRKRRGAQPGVRSSRATEFKKGVLTGVNLRRLQPIGTTMVKKRNYGQGKCQFKKEIYIKINDIPYGNYGVNWVLYSRFLWIKWYGSIPKGLCVVFLDMDHTNFSRDNLACMKRVDYMRYLEARYPKRLVQRRKRISISVAAYNKQRRLVETERKTREVSLV